MKIENITTAAHRARLNVEAFVAAVLEREPMPLVGRIIEGIATSTEAALRSTIANTTWHHEGLGDFVRTLSRRLLPLDVLAPVQVEVEQLDPRVEARAMRAGPIPREVRSSWRREAERGQGYPHTERTRILALLDHIDRLDSLVERLIERLGEPGAPPMTWEIDERVSLEALVEADKRMREVAAGNGHLTSFDVRVIADLFAAELARRRARVDAVVVTAGEGGLR